MNMKKMISLLAVAALTCTMGTTAFAADQDGVGTGSYNTDVKGTYQAAVPALYTAWISPGPT